MKSKFIYSLIRRIDPMIRFKMGLESIRIKYIACNSKEYMWRTHAKKEGSKVEFEIYFSYNTIWSQWNSENQSYGSNSDEFLAFIIICMLHELSHVKQIKEISSYGIPFATISLDRRNDLEAEADRNADKLFDEFGKNLIQVIRDTD